MRPRMLSLEDVFVSRVMALERRRRRRGPLNLQQRIGAVAFKEWKETTRDRLFLSLAFFRRRCGSWYSGTG